MVISDIALFVVDRLAYFYQLAELYYTKPYFIGTPVCPPTSAFVAQLV
jgi:hypothetical protein